MFTNETPIEKQIQFYENKINQYLDVIKVNEKGSFCQIWIDWIVGWNKQITELKSRLDK